MANSINVYEARVCVCVGWRETKATQGDKWTGQLKMNVELVHFERVAISTYLQIDKVKKKVIIWKDQKIFLIFKID